MAQHIQVLKGKKKSAVKNILSQIEGEIVSQTNKN